MVADRNSDDYRRGYSHGKALGSGLFRIGAVRDELERARLFLQENADNVEEASYHTGVRDALKTRETELKKAWKGW